MTSREIVLANLNHERPPRPGMTFSGGRINDMVGAGPGPSAMYTQKRWVEDNVEYYDDEWGGLWKRMVGGCVKGEVHKAFLDDWSKLDRLVPPDYSDPARYMKAGSEHRFL